MTKKILKFALLTLLILNTTSNTFAVGIFGADFQTPPTNISPLIQDKTNPSPLPYISDTPLPKKSPPKPGFFSNIKNKVSDLKSPPKPGFFSNIKNKVSDLWSNSTTTEKITTAIGVASTVTGAISAFNNTKKTLSGLFGKNKQANSQNNLQTTPNGINNGINNLPNNQSNISPNIGQGAGVYIPQTNSYYTNPISTLEGGILALTNYILFFLGFLAGIIIIYGGIKMMTGGEEGAKSGIKTVQWAIVGIVIVVFSYSIVNFILRGLATGDTNNTNTTPPPAGKGYTNPYQNGSGSGNFNISVSNTPTPNQVFVKIKASNDTGQVPFSVLLDGSESLDPSGQTIPNASFNWNYLDLNGTTQKLFDLNATSKSFQKITFSAPGTYTIRLNITSLDPTITAGTAILRITAKPRIITQKLTINSLNVTNSSFIKILSDTAQKGINFDFSGSNSLTSNIISTDINFGDGNREIYQGTPASIIHYYPQAQKYTLRTEIKDQTNNNHIKFLDLIINNIIAKIKTNTTTGTISTPLTLSSTTSAISSTTTLNQTQWEALMIKDSRGQEITQPTDIWLKKFDNQPNFTTTLPHAGTYLIRLTITGSAGSNTDGTPISFNDIAKKIITIKSAPPKPAFTITFPKKGHPTQALFDASRTFDPDSKTLLYNWEIDGKKYNTLTKLTTPLAQFQFATKGTHHITLTVLDDQNNQSQTTHSTTITSTLNLQLQPSTTTRNLNPQTNQAQISFSAQTSAPTQALHWDFGDGTKITQNRADTPIDQWGNITHNYTKSGTFTTTLTAQDETQSQTTLTQKITIGPKNLPTAHITLTLKNITPPQKPNICLDPQGKSQNAYLLSRLDNITFDSSLSTNSKNLNSLLDINWTFSNGATSKTPKLTRNISELSQKDKCDFITLKVKDKSNQRISEPDTLYFLIQNKKPTLNDLNLTPPQKLTTPLTLTLSATNPRDLDGKIVTYKWYYYDINDTGTKLGLHTTKTPTTQMLIETRGASGQQKTYNFIVELIDNNKALTNSETYLQRPETLTITNGTIIKPTLELSATKTNLKQNETAYLYANTLDPNTQARIPNLIYQWDFDGDGNYDLSAPNRNATFKYPSSGTFNATVRTTFQGQTLTQSLPLTITPQLGILQSSFTYLSDPQTRYTIFNNNSKGQTTNQEWDFDLDTDSNQDGDPTNDIDSTKFSPTHTYPTNKKYRSKLTIYNQQKRSDSSVGLINLAQLNPSNTITPYPKPDNSKDLQAIITTSPRLDPRDHKIHLTTQQNTLNISAAYSRGIITTITIDQNTAIDTNQDGDPTNDIDNQNHPSLTNKFTPFAITYLPTLAPFTIKLTVKNNDKSDSISLPIVFDLPNLTPTQDTPNLATTQKQILNLNKNKLTPQDHKILNQLQNPTPELLKTPKLTPNNKTNIKNALTNYHNTTTKLNKEIATLIQNHPSFKALSPKLSNISQLQQKITNDPNLTPKTRQKLLQQTTQIIQKLKQAKQKRQKTLQQNLPLTPALKTQLKLIQTANLLAGNPSQADLTQAATNIKTLHLAPPTQDALLNQISAAKLNLTPQTFNPTQAQTKIITAIKLLPNTEKITAIRAFRNIKTGTPTEKYSALRHLETIINDSALPTNTKNQTLTALNNLAKKGQTKQTSLPTNNTTISDNKPTIINPFNNNPTTNNINNNTNTTPNTKSEPLWLSIIFTIATTIIWLIALLALLVIFLLIAFHLYKRQPQNQDIELDEFIIILREKLLNPHLKPTTEPTKTPEIPEAQPEIPEAQPEIPEAQPEIPEAQPEIPEAQPESDTTPNWLNTQPTTPETPEIPEAQPEIPEAQPEIPEAQPQIPDNIIIETPKTIKETTKKSTPKTPKKLTTHKPLTELPITTTLTELEAPKTIPEIPAHLTSQKIENKVNLTKTTPNTKKPHRRRRRKKKSNTTTEPKQN